MVHDGGGREVAAVQQITWMARGVLDDEAQAALLADGGELVEQAVVLGALLQAVECVFDTAPGRPPLSASVVKSK